MRATTRWLSRSKWISACVGGAIAIGCAGRTGPTESAAPRVPSGKQELASEAYVYAYPLVLFDRTRKAQVDAIGAHNRLIVRATTGTPFTQGGVRPDADTVSAVAYLDLRNGPLMLSIPDSGKRFTRIELIDAYTSVFASLGQRSKGNGAATYAIVGPGWSSDVSGATTVRSPTNLALLQAQIATEGERDVPEASGLMRQWTLTPLATYAKGKRVAAVPRPHGAAALESPVKNVEALSAAKYAEEATHLMKQNPPTSTDGPLVKKFATIGMDWQKDKYVAGKGNADAAWNDARARIRAAQPAGRESGGWVFAAASGSFGVDYLSRAAAARVGVGGTALAEDTIEATTRVDSSGERLTGAHRYEIDFKKAPPVHAFWSLTLIDEQGRMVDNVINRYAVRGDRLGKDAKKVLVQFAPPAGTPANWLPAPKHPFSLVLRLYWPKPDAFSGGWTPPAVKRID
jgi:hypothetical protein